jgi:hypothetical protein
MRYRLQTGGLELVLAVFPFIDGVRELLHPQRHTYHGAGLLWHMVYPYLLVCAPLLVILRYLYSYVELTPSSLEYQDTWRHRSIPYTDIEKVAVGTGDSWRVTVGTTEIQVFGMKKLSVKLAKTEDFLTELRLYAPLAFVEAAVTR